MPQQFPVLSSLVSTYMPNQDKAINIKAIKVVFGLALWVKLRAQLCGDREVGGHVQVSVLQKACQVPQRQLWRSDALKKIHGLYCFVFYVMF